MILFLSDSKYTNGSELYIRTHTKHSHGIPVVLMAQSMSDDHIGHSHHGIQGGIQGRKKMLRD